MHITLFYFLFSLGIVAADWQPVEVFKGQRSNTAIAADFDGDGQNEIIYSSMNKLFLVSIDGKRTRELASNVKVIHSAIADLDNDGDVDYIGGLEHVIWLDTPKDIWKDEWKLKIVSDELKGTHAVEAIDMDKDGKMDVVANSFKGEGKYPFSICWFKNLGDGKFETYPLADRDAFGGSHYFKIFDLDGKRALCAAAKGNQFINGNYFALYKEDKTLQSPWSKSYLLENQSGATNIIPADFDKDGTIDYVTSNGHGIGLKIIHGKDQAIIELDTEMESPHSLDVSDIDGDGDLDIATCGYASAVVAWYENNGAMKFKKHIIKTEQKAYDLRISDFDGDGLKDILLGGQGSKNVIWFKQVK